MRILDRYLYTKLSLYFLIIFPSFSIISGFVELVELLRKIKDPKADLMAIYVLSKIPENSYYILPISLLIAVFILILDLKKSREIYPILTGGIPIYYINSRFIIASVVVSILQVVNLQTVMPLTTQLSQEIYRKLKNQDEQHHKTIIYNLWLRVSDNTFIYFDVYDSTSKSGRGLVLTEFDIDLKPVKRVEAHEFYLENGKIVLKNYKKIEIKSITDVKIETSSGQTEVQTKIDHKDLEKLILQKKPVSLTQIYKIARIASRYGYEPSYYWSRLLQKVATVISPLVLVVFGLSFFWHKDYYRISIGFLSVLIYWYSIAVITSIAETGKLPFLVIPAIDVVFLIAGGYLLSRVKEPGI